MNPPVHVITWAEVAAIAVICLFTLGALWFVRRTAKPDQLDELLRDVRRPSDQRWFTEQKPTPRPQRRKPRSQQE